MLAALLTFLFLSSGSTTGLLFDFSDVKKQVKQVVVDEDSRDAALENVKSLKARNKAHAKSIKSTSKSLEKMLEDTTTSDELILAELDSHMEYLAGYYSDLADLRFALRDNMTREEWQQAFPAAN